MHACDVLDVAPRARRRRLRIWNWKLERNNYIIMATESTCLKSGKKSKKVSNYITRKNTLKARVWEYVEGDVDSPLEYLLLFLIFLNVVALFVSTMVLDSDCYGDDCLRLGDDDSPYGKLFAQIEFISVCIFL